MVDGLKCGLQSTTPDFRKVSQWTSEVREDKCQFVESSLIASRTDITPGDLVIGKKNQINDSNQENSVMSVHFQQNPFKGFALSTATRINFSRPPTTETLPTH